MEAPAQFLHMMLALEKTQEPVQPHILLYIWEEPEPWKEKRVLQVRTELMSWFQQQLPNIQLGDLPAALTRPLSQHFPTFFSWSDPYRPPPDTPQNLF